MAINHNMVIDQGSDFEQSFHLGLGGSPILMEYYDVRSQMRKKHNSDDYVNFTVSKGTSDFQIKLSNGQTKHLTAGSYVYDVQLTQDYNPAMGYVDDDTDSVVFYTIEQLAALNIFIFEVYLGIDTIDSDRIPLLDMNQSGAIQIADTGVIYDYAESKGNDFLLAYEDLVQQQYSDTSLVNKLKTGNVSALTQGHFVDRVVQGGVTVTREVSR